MTEYSFTENDYNACFPNLKSGCNGSQNMIDYEISVDFTSVKSSTLVNNGADFNPLTFEQVRIEDTKDFCSKMSESTGDRPATDYFEVIVKNDENSKGGRPAMDLSRIGIIDWLLKKEKPIILRIQLQNIQIMRFP